MARAAEIGAGGRSLRPTGILPLDSLPWGAHICLFYETPQDLIDATAGFFSAGLAENEFCFWVLSDGIDRDRAIAGLREAIADFDDYLAAGAIEMVAGDEWYDQIDTFDLNENLASLRKKLDAALSRGFVGMRASGYAFWRKANLWQTFRKYEEELGNALSGRPVIGLCAYKLRASWATNLLDVARVHHFSIILRKGKWEILESPESGEPKREIGRANEIIEVPQRAFPGHDRLTERERATLTQIVNGASNKEAARALDISPRTVEFHRANIMRKLDASNVAELVWIVLGTG